MAVLGHSTVQQSNALSFSNVPCNISLLRPRTGALLQNLFPRQQDAATSEFSDALRRIHASGMLEVTDECNTRQKIRSALRFRWRLRVARQRDDVQQLRSACHRCVAICAGRSECDGERRGMSRFRALGFNFHSRSNPSHRHAFKSRLCRNSFER